MKDSKRVALTGKDRIDHYVRLERERIHWSFLDDVEKGVADVKAGCVRDARTALAELKRNARQFDRERSCRGDRRL